MRTSAWCIYPHGRWEYHTEFGLDRRDLCLDGRVDVAGLIGDVDLKHERADRLASRNPDHRIWILPPPISDDTEIGRGLLAPPCAVDRLACLWILFASC